MAVDSELSAISKIMRLLAGLPNDEARDRVGTYCYQRRLAPIVGPSVTPHHQHRDPATLDMLEDLPDADAQSAPDGFDEDVPLTPAPAAPVPPAARQRRARAAPVDAAA